MRGLAVIGASSRGDALAVAEALSDELDGARLVGVVTGRRTAPPGVVALEPAATPHVAARHAGVALDPGELLDRARASDGAVVVAVTSGGLLAPLAAHYTARDLARELELTVVVVVAAGPDVFNEASLTVEAARGAGLTVAAVVATGWPAEPPRALLDEWRLLGELAPVPALVLGRDALRAADWLTATATGGAVALEPYRAWEPRPLPDPRSAGRAEIMPALESIVEAEGPMRASRTYAVYNRAAGGRKLTSVARAPLSGALYWLARERRVVLTRADDIPWQQDDLVRMPDSPAVRVRELGGRTLEEVPLDEIAELIRRLHRAGAARDATGLKRAVLSTYRLVRLTARADEYLGLALDLAEV